MQAARELPGAVWDTRMEAWRLPKVTLAEKHIEQAGLSEYLISQPLVSNAPTSAQKMVRDYLRARSQERVQDGGAGTATQRSATSADSSYQTDPERLRPDGGVRQVISDAQIKPHLDAYTKKLATLGLSKVAVKKYRAALKAYAEWLPCELPFATSAMRQAYLSYCYERRCE